MEIDITQELLDEIYIFLNKETLVNCMINSGLSIEAMSIILQSIISTINGINKHG